MGTGKNRRAFDAFLSHAHENKRFALSLARSLEKMGLRPWIDRKDIRVGGLLLNQLHSAIRDSRALVLLWSKAAWESRWVMSEIFAAFHLNRFIVPCVLDETPLPQFLGNKAYLERTRDRSSLVASLARAIQEAPAHANEQAPVISARAPAVQSLIERAAAAQKEVNAVVGSDLKKAAKANSAAEKELRRLDKLAPVDLMVLNLRGYQCKNSYTIKHWDQIQAGQAPKSPELLDRGERYFFETLCVDPTDESAINGLGTVLFYQRELEAAEFFQRRAIQLAKRRGGDYREAQEDLRLTLRFKTGHKRTLH